MIFWTGKPLAPLASIYFVENVCSQQNIYRGINTYSQLYHYFTQKGGTGVVRRFAIKFDDRMDVYFFESQKRKRNPVAMSFPVVSEFSQKFPESFIIETENIELLRELIARGHKITWYLPNLVKFSHLLPQMNFEHLVIDPFLKNDIVLPDGTYKREHFKRETTRKSYILLRNGNAFPYAKMLGFNLWKGILGRYNIVSFYRYKWKIGKPHRKRNYIISFYMAVAYYNILSITYMLCKKSFVTNVKKRTARKG